MRSNRKRKGFVLIYVLPLIGFTMAAMLTLTFIFQLKLEDSRKLSDLAEKANTTASARNYDIFHSYQVVSETPVDADITPVFQAEQVIETDLQPLPIPEPNDVEDQ